MRHLSTLLLFCVVSAAAAADGIDGGVAGFTALDRLQRGEVLVYNARTDESGGSVRAQVLMHTDARTVWDYIADCERVFLYVDGLRDCEVLAIEREGENGLGADVTTLRQAVDKSWAVPRMDYVLSVRREPWDRVDFSLVEGDLRVLEGGWRFLELAEGKGLVVTHEIRVRPKYAVPRWLLRRSMRRDVPDMLACLRGLTGGSGDALEQEDLARCPEPRGKQARD